MAKTKLHKIRAKNLITGQHRWFTEIMWNKLARMDRIHNGKTYPRQAWVQIPIERAPEPQAAKEAARKAAEQKKKQELSEAEKQAAREAEKKRAAKVAAEKQEAAKQAAAQAAKEANAAAKKSK